MDLLPRQVLPVSLASILRQAVRNGAVELLRGHVKGLRSKLVLVKSILSHWTGIRSGLIQLLIEGRLRFVVSF